MTQQEPTEEIALVIGGKTNDNFQRLHGNLLKWLRKRGHHAVMPKKYTEYVIEMIRRDESGKPYVLAAFPWEADTFNGIFTAHNGMPMCAQQI